MCFSSTPVDNRECAVSVASLNGIERLVSLLDSADMRIKSTAVLAIANVTQGLERNVDRLRTAGGFPRIVECAQRLDSLTNRAIACGVLCNAARFVISSRHFIIAC